MPGLRGSKGFAGAPGVKGDIGAPGLPGVTGPIGSEGDDGAKGERGDSYAIDLLNNDWKIQAHVDQLEGLVPAVVYLVHQVN